jgi:hypothetical protein
MEHKKQMHRDSNIRDGCRVARSVAYVEREREIATERKKERERERQHDDAILLEIGLFIKDSPF